MSLIKELWKLKKVNKHLKRSPGLKKDMDVWLEQHFKTSDDDKLLKILQQQPDRIKEINDYYDSVKNKY